MNTSNNLNHKNKSVLLDLLLKRLLVISLLVLLIMAAIANTLVVQEDELVVIKQFGRVQRIIDEPGLFFKLPLVQSTDTLTKKLADYEIQPIKVFSKDKRNIILRNYAVWKITEPHSFINNVHTIGSAEVMIESAVYSAVRQEYSKLSYDEIIKGIAAGKDYNEEITAAVRNQLQNTGMEILDVRLMRLELTADEEQIAYSKIKSEREKIAKENIFMAENEATEIKAEADKQAKIIISQAYAASEEIKGQADAEAAKIYAKSYNQDPEFYKFMRTLESYKKTLKGKPTIILPIDSPYTKYLIGK
ncbi:MAG TPA: protease modulator HflC [Clostridia bacterium]|nr:protease modulator HflC [Clostridia bacterium]